MIAIIDYGMGNLRSVQKALERLGHAAEVTRDPARIASDLDAYNAIAAELCAQHGVAFVDITGISREHGTDPAMLVADGLHPSGAMYALWTAQALPVARRLLSEARA